MATIQHVVQLEESQAGDLNEVEATIQRAETEIESLESLNIRESDRRAKAQEIRDKAITEVRDRRAAAVQRVKDAAAMAREFEPQTFRRAALQGDATRVAPLIALYQHAPTAELFGFLQDAVEAGNIAAAEALRHEFDRRKRTAEEIRRFANILAGLKLPTDQANEKLGNVRSMGAMIDNRITELLRGRKNSIGRLNALRTGTIGHRA